MYTFSKSPAVECVELPQLDARVWGAAFCDNYSPAMLHGFSRRKAPGE